MPVINKKSFYAPSDSAFKILYEKQNNQPMSGEQTVFMQNLIEKIWDGGAEE